MQDVYLCSFELFQARQCFTTILNDYIYVLHCHDKISNAVVCNNNVLTPDSYIWLYSQRRIPVWVCDHSITIRKEMHLCL